MRFTQAGRSTHRSDGRVVIVVWLKRFWAWISLHWQRVYNTAPRDDLEKLSESLQKTRDVRLVRPEWIGETFRTLRQEWGPLGPLIDTTLSALLRIKHQDASNPSERARAISKLPFLPLKLVQQLRGFIVASGLSAFGVPIREIATGQSSLTQPDAVLFSALHYRVHGTTGQSVFDLVRYIESLRHFIGKFDVLALESPHGPASRSLMLIKVWQQGEYDPIFIEVCHVTPSNTGGELHVRSGFAFDLLGTISCILFEADAAKLRDFMSADEFAHLSADPSIRISTPKGTKFVTLSPFRSGEDAITVFEQSIAGPALCLARRRSTIASGDDMTTADLSRVRKLAVNDDGTLQNPATADDDERNLIRRLKSYPVLNFSAGPRWAALRST